jgi:glucans biosynthesis protein
VHDSDGLLMLTGRGETLWRALANPRALQVSSFMDKTPRGFGLMQRKRKLDDYQDLESNYETRPACWVEPAGDWGEGNVVLVEIPTDSETNDNIVAFWRPKQTLQAKIAYNFAYRLHWSAGAPVKTPAPFTATMVGDANNGIRNFVLNIGGLKPELKPRLDVTSDKGKLLNLLMQPDPLQGGWRISFDLDPGRETLVELHARLMQGDAPLTETWMYRWTS